jgi:hypothetical protein
MNNAEYLFFIYKLNPGNPYIRKLQNSLFKLSFQRQLDIASFIRKYPKKLLAKRFNELLKKFVNEQTLEDYHKKQFEELKGTIFEPHYETSQKIEGTFEEVYFKPKRNVLLLKSNIQVMEELK